MTNFNSMLVAILPRLRAFAIVLTRDRNMADDAVQEAVTRALSFQDKFKVGTNFSAWMHRVLRNVVITEWRIKQRVAGSVDTIQDQLLADAAPADDIVLLRELTHAMDRLPYPQKEALLLICGSGLTYEEAAAVQGCSLGTIKSRLFRAKAFVNKIARDEVLAVEGEAANEASTSGAPAESPTSQSPTASARVN